ncbi:MAG: ABC transporter permease [Oceanospirillaceae bacterium]|nr:ABC transporter permease [Oceanospirillaceae bacterium]MCP5334527.1 ABC transporter permease [Oceanospirillaceae bacterium]MCP5350768.1 ABC transporter permease [Oceanospirillaceae bacterium]
MQIMLDVVHALFMRELRTRFGANRLGYFWAIAEPALQAGIMVVVFSAMGRHSLSGVPVALFMLTGIMPYKLFSKLLTHLGAAVKANRGLISYRQVTPIDPIVTRLIIEFTTVIIIYVLLLAVMGWLGLSVIPDNFLKLLMAMLLLMFVAVGLGIMLCVAQLYWEDTGKIVSIVTTPLMIASGVFYSATMIPEQYWHFFTWNPIFHAIELSRDAFFPSYTTPVGSWFYLGACALISMTVALMIYRVNRQRFMES